MSSHGITHPGEHLEFLHSQIMKAIYEVVNQNNPFVPINTQLALDCSNIARNVFRTLSVSRLDDLVKGRLGEFETFGAYPPKDEKLAESVEKIYTKMLEHLDNIPQTFLARILKSSAEMKGGGDNIFSINNNFLPFQRKKGQLQPNNDRNSSCIKF
jgi:hypothetical protein